MKFPKMNAVNRLRRSLPALATALLLGQFLAPASLRAADLYLTVTGTGASGAIGTDASGSGGTPFANENWAVEFRVDTTAAGYGSTFASSIREVKLLLAGRLYTVAQYFGGTLQISNWPFDALSFQSENNSWLLQFTQGPGGLIPVLLTNPESLDSFNLGTTVTNTVSPPSYVSGPFFGMSPATRTDEGYVRLIAETTGNSGLWSVSANSKSQLAPVITFESLRAAITQSLAAGGIDNAGTAQSLLTKLKGTPGKTQLNAFLNELNAQKGKHINDAAYTLLQTQATYLLSTLP